MRINRSVRARYDGPEPLSKVKLMFVSPWQLDTKGSDLFIVTYLVGTLGFRFLIEPYLQGITWISLFLGLLPLLFLYALVKVRFLNPGWFSWRKSDSETY